jgi:hypothetical protein
MESGLSLALQFIRENPLKEEPAATAEKLMICGTSSSGEQITVYWDFAYGAVLVNSLGAKRLNNVQTEYPLQPSQHITELGLDKVSIQRRQLEFAKDRDGNAVLIVIQTITNGLDMLHGSLTFSTLVYNLTGQLIFEIGGGQELHSDEPIDRWMNWFMTPDTKWLILWRLSEFQPVICNIAELEQKVKKTGWWLRIDRLDWVPTITPYPLTSLYYLANLTSRPDKPNKAFDTEIITLEAYRKHLIDNHELKEGDKLVESGYLVIDVNGWHSEYTGCFSREDFAGKLGISSSHHSRDSHMPITVKSRVMIDLHRRSLMPR